MELAYTLARRHLEDTLVDEVVNYAYDMALSCTNANLSNIMRVAKRLMELDTVGGDWVRGIVVHREYKAQSCGALRPTLYMKTKLAIHT